jgi:hypothetical protein
VIEAGNVHDEYMRQPPSATQTDLILARAPTALIKKCDIRGNFCQAFLRRARSEIDPRRRVCHLDEKFCVTGTGRLPRQDYAGCVLT